MNSVPALTMPDSPVLTVAFAPLHEPVFATMQDQPASGGPAARVPGQAPTQGAPAGQAAAGGGEGTVAPGGVGGTGPAAQATPKGPDMMFFILLSVFAFMIISMMMSGRKQRKQTAQMLAGLSRGDTVQTNGGIIAVVGEVRDDVVTLKIDESNHTKMKVTKASISRIVKMGHDRDVVDASEPSEPEAA